jgi:hypothetical protein
VNNSSIPEPGDYRKLFVIGCPRSGTTWIQLLLSQLDEIATAPETQIFAYYLVQFERQWREEHGDPTGNQQGRAGLSRVLSQAEFDDLCRRSARAVLDKIRSERPGAGVVVEKSPKHALHATFIRRLFPDAYFLHVIRDPRDTACSLMAAGRDWGGSWAPRNAIQAARMWVEHVEHGRLVADEPLRYREVQYERMKADPVRELGAILDWLGVPVAAERCRQAVEACEFSELKKVRVAEGLPLPGTHSPAGFFRRGEAGAWKDDLTRGEVRAVEYLCGDLMADLGYERSRATPGAPARLLLHDGIQRVRESIDWQLSRLLAAL